MRKRAGFTFMEVLFYVTLSMLATLAISALFSLGRSAQQTTVSGFLVSGETDSALRWIRRDLQETAQVSLCVYPSPMNPAQPPGCSFVSARDSGDKNPNFNISKYAKPLWNKNVFYSLKPGSDGRSGDLVRWEVPLTPAEKDFVPRPTTVMPNLFSNGENRRVLLRQVLMPNQKVSQLDTMPSYQTDQFGGFRVQFVHYLGAEDGVEQLTSINPGDTSQPQVAANNTRLIKVRLEILSDDKYKPSFFQLEMSIHPRY